MNRIDFCNNIIQSIKNYITDSSKMEPHRAKNHFTRNRKLSMLQTEFINSDLFKCLKFYVISVVLVSLNNYLKKLTDVALRLYLAEVFGVKKAKQSAAHISGTKKYHFKVHKKIFFKAVAYSFIKVRYFFHLFVEIFQNQYILSQYQKRYHLFISFNSLKLTLS